MCRSYLLVPPFLYLYIASKRCSDIRCGENAKCVIDPLMPKYSHCVCLEGYRENADGVCVGKLNLSGLFLLCCSFLIKINFK